MRRMKFYAVVLLILLSTTLQASRFSVCGAVGTMSGIAVLGSGIRYAETQYSSEFSVTEWDKFVRFMVVGYYKAALYAMSGIGGLASMILVTDVCLGLSLDEN